MNIRNIDPDTQATRAAPLAAPSLNVVVRDFETGNPVIEGIAERGSLVTIKNLHQGITLGSVVASELDGSWSFTIESKLRVSGLHQADGSASAANGVYSLLPLTEAMRLRESFGSEFSSSGHTVLDTAKASYKMNSHGQTWYVWAQLDGGYLISRTSGEDEWYQERSQQAVRLPEWLSDQWGWDGRTHPDDIVVTSATTPAASHRWMAGTPEIRSWNGIDLSNLTQRITVEQTDKAGRRSDINMDYVVITNVTPYILDLDAYREGTQTLLETTARPDDLKHGTSFIADLDRSIVGNGIDVTSMNVTLSGDDLNLTGDKLLLDEALNLDKDLPWVYDRTVGGVNGVDYTYDSNTRTLRLERTHQPIIGSAFYGNSAEKVIESLRLQNADGTPGKRSISITMEDSPASTATLIIAAPGARDDLPLVTATLLPQYIPAYRMIELGDVLGAKNSHNLGKGESISLSLPGTMNAKQFLGALKGMSMEWGGLGITGQANTTSAQYKSFMKFDHTLSAGEKFSVAHQGGTHVKGAVLSFATVDEGRKLSLTHHDGFYDKGDVYALAGDAAASSGHYDIGHLRLLYQSATVNAHSDKPTISLRLDGGKMAVGDVVSLHEGDRMVASKTITAADFSGPDAAMLLTLTEALSSGHHRLTSQYTTTAGEVRVGHGVDITVASAPALTDLKIASPNSDTAAQTLNESSTRYASVSDAGTPWITGNYDRGLVFSGKVGTAGSTDQYLISVSMGGKVLAFDTVAAGDFSLASAANLLAPGYYDDLSISATNISSGEGNGLSTTVQGLKLGHYWAAQSLGDTRGGHGNDNFLLGATKNGLNTLIQTNGGDDTLTLGAFGKKGNFAATVTDFTAGADKIAVFGKSIDLGNLSQFVKEVAPIQGGNGTKVVVDLDGAAAGNQTYTLHLQNVAYQPANTHTLFGV
ncbi:hypothetical protein ABIC71_003617 [Herbaspirillum seropedicae]|uniref:hypothetical protein n=1 Tax=Herbaspirillum seropedicae TaxID=964 RepID=UPI003398AF33